MATVVLLLGGECTGKTALARALANDASERQSIPTKVIPEVLRDFVSRHGRLPEQHEQADILREQTRLLDDAITHAAAGALVICDPAPVMTAVYSIQYFDDDSLIDSAVADTNRDCLVVWCAPDLPWESDGIFRDGPEARRLTHEIIRSRVLPGLEISDVVSVEGSIEERMAQVMAYLR